MAVLFGAAAAGQASSFAPDYAEAKIAARRLIQLLGRKPKIDSYNRDGIIPVRNLFLKIIFR